MADIAADYAALIADEFGGRVDLVVGLSFGGMVGSTSPRTTPDRFGHIAIVVAAYGLSERGRAIDMGCARHLSEGRSGEAMATMLQDGPSTARLDARPTTRRAWRACRLPRHAPGVRERRARGSGGRGELRCPRRPAAHPGPGAARLRRSRRVLLQGRLRGDRSAHPRLHAPDARGQGAHARGVRWARRQGRP